MICPQCGADVDPTEAFCQGCGRELGSEVAGLRAPGIQFSVTTRKVARIICGKCGKEIPAGERKCPSCGLAVPSMEEIEAKLAKARATPGAGTAADSRAMKCPHCGKPLELRDGLCTNCGQKVELPEFVRKALQGVSPSGLHVSLISSTPKGISAKWRVKMNLFTVGIVAGVLGLVFLLAARPSFSFQGPFTPAHISALVLLGVGVIMVIVGKLSGS